MRLACAGKPGEQYERARADELDDGPLLVGDLHVGAVRRREQLDGCRVRPLRQCKREPALHLVQLAHIRAVAVQHDFRREHERPYRRLELLDLADLEQLRRSRPELVDRQKRVPVGLRLLEREEEAGAQPLRIVQLDPDRARDAVGDLEPDPRQLGRVGTGPA